MVSKIKYIILFVLISLFNLQLFAAPLQPLTIVLDWFPNPNHAPIFVAQQQGFFAKQGLNVKIIGPADPSDPPKLVAAGKADLGVMYEPQLIIDTSQGLPLVQIATLIPTPLTCLAVLNDSSIQNLHDLKGKKIGYSDPGIDLAALTVELNSVGLTLKDVTLINVHYNLTQALLTHQVDAVTGMMRNYELIQLKQIGHPARAFYPEEHGLPYYSELVIVTNKNEVNDPRIAKFVTALQQGTHYLINHPESSWALFAKQHPALNNALNQQVWMDSLPYFALRPAIYDPTSYQQMADLLQKQGLIHTIIPVTSYVISLTHG